MTDAGASIIGVDIGGTKCAVARLEPGGRVTETLRLATRGPDDTLSALAAGIEALGFVHPPIIGISAGTLGAGQGLISGAPNLPGWNDVPIVDFFQRRFGGPAYLMNDAKACALAEWLHGAGQGFNHLAFLTLGTGIGAGLILDGRLYLGVGNAGEIGHVRLAPAGPEGYGKPGSVEGFCSGGGIGRWARSRFLERGPSAAFGRARVEDVTAADVGAAARRGESAAQELLAEAGGRLGEALALLIDILNLECIVLGSLFVRCRPWMEPAMLATLAREALPSSLTACRIVPSALGEEVGNYGSIAVAQYCSGVISSQ